MAAVHLIVVGVLWPHEGTGPATNGDSRCRPRAPTRRKDRHRCGRRVRGPGLQGTDTDVVGRVLPRGVRTDIGAGAGSGDPAYKGQTPML